MCGRAKGRCVATSELRYRFQYAVDEQPDFFGDDDVRVCVNGRLALDLGGMHLAGAGAATTAKMMAATRLRARLPDLGPHCGDGVIQAAQGEECDDGNRDPKDGCDNGCQAGQATVLRYGARLGDGGRARHGTPVLRHHNTASMNLRSWILAHGLSES